MPVKNRSAVEKNEPEVLRTGRDILLDVRNFSLWMRGEKGEVQILNRLNFQLCRGDYLGIAGESGAGKSMTVHALTGLLPLGNVRMEGSIEFYDEQGNGTDVLQLSGRERQRFCSAKTSLILQDSMNALNPYETIGHQWARVIRLQQEQGKYIKKRNKSRRCDPDSEIMHYMMDRLTLFGLGGQEEILEKYPHQISGGMKQRAAIAMALESRAELLIADEPTTALDAVNQRRTVEFIRELCDKNSLTLLYVSHNPGILKELCSHIMVMKEGTIVETGKTEAVFGNPQHPYTAQLIRQTKELGRTLAGAPDGRRTPARR